MIMLFDGPEQRKPKLPIEMLSRKDFVPTKDGEPRVVDWRLAQVLGLQRETNIRQLTEHHRPDLEQFAALHCRDAKSTGGRPGTEYHYTFEQAMFITVVSRARNWNVVLVHIIQIYGLWARGKLQPLDAATGTAIAVATAQTVQESPIVMGMLQGLLDQILTGQGDLSNRVESVQRTALDIQKRLNYKVNRGRPSVGNIETYDRVIEEFYVGRCPCCGKHLIIVDGKHTDLYELDHATDHPGKSSLYEMWPVCKYDNRKFKNDPLYRAKTMDAFRLFQRRVAEIIGERLI